MNKAYQIFCKRYNARVQPSRQRMAKLEPISYHTDWMKDNDFINSYTNTYEVSCVEVLMPEEDFGTLINTIEEIEDPKSDWSQFEYYKKRLGPDFIERAIHQISKEDREREIRQRVPALQKAWDNYQLLLQLSKES